MIASVSHIGITMKHLAAISYVITMTGVFVITASIAADLSPLFLMIGILLLIAGVVKIAVVHIWRQIAGL